MQKIIYEDDEVIVLHKPGGIPVQTSRAGQKDIVSILKNYRAQKNEEPYIGIVHRLDQPVEGLLVAAKSKEAAAGLSRESRDREMDKYYRAVVYNASDRPLREGAEGTLWDYLLRDGRTNSSAVVPQGTAGAKRAELTYRVLRVRGKIAELEIRLHTGRHHQIRVQMAHAGLPLVGDRKYGGREANAVEGAGRNVALCSVKCAFTHPRSGEKMQFETEPENETFRLF